MLMVVQVLAKSKQDLPATMFFHLLFVQVFVETPEELLVKYVMMEQL